MQFIFDGRVHWTGKHAVEEFSQEVNYASILVQLFLKPIRILIKSILYIFLLYLGTLVYFM